MMAMSPTRNGPVGCASWSGGFRSEITRATTNNTAITNRSGTPNQPHGAAITLNPTTPDVSSSVASHPVNGSRGLRHSNAMVTSGRRIVAKKMFQTTMDCLLASEAFQQVRDQPLGEADGDLLDGARLLVERVSVAEVHFVV